jgi:hypothetical protein
MTVVAGIDPRREHGIGLCHEARDSGIGDPSGGGGAMTDGCELSERDEARAYWTGDSLLLVATGSLPETCWDVDIDRSLLDVWPPEFILRRCRTTSICLEVITPFTVADYFSFGSRPDTVVLHHRDGRDEIDVQDIPTDQIGRTFAAWPVGEEAEDFDEAVGLSPKLSFDEAFANALAQLPSWKPAFPDDMATVLVVETGAWFGGIGGFHHLFVRVRRPKRPGR